MSSVNTLKNSYSNYSKVLLESINDAQIDDENLEPQFIRLRSNNLGNLYVGSTSEFQNNFNPSQLLLNAKSLATRKIRRISLTALDINYRIPNINPRNYTITIFSSVTSLTHTVNLSEGFYSTALALATELVAKLNTLTGASGLTFTAVVNPIDNSVYTINAAGGNFYFVNSSPLVNKGLFLINLESTQTLSSSKIAGPMNLYYTRYIDVTSRELCQYDKNPSGSTDDIFKVNNLERIFLYQEPDSVVGQPFRDFVEFPNPRWFNYNRTQSIGTIDLTFYDENGDYLYIPTYGNNNLATAFWVKFIFTTEL